MKKKELVFREVGKIMVNVGNLVLASLVFGSILKGDERWLIPSISGAIALVLMVLGVHFLTKGGEKWQH
jgi:hypothetical protein